MDKGRNMMICPNGFSIDQMVNGNIGIRIHDVLYEIRVTPHTNANDQTEQPCTFALLLRLVWFLNSGAH